MNDLFSIRPNSLFRWVIIFFFAIGACSSQESIRWDHPKYDTETPLQWPPAPQKARILFIRTIENVPQNVATKSFVKRVVNRLFGEEKLSSRLLRPYGVYVRNENVYVADPGSSSFHVFDSQRKKYFSVDKAGKENLVSPIGIAVDHRGDIYVSDSLLKKIFVFGPDGRYARAIMPPDVFQRPAGIAIDDDRLYVVDTHKHAVHVLSTIDGKMLFSFGKQGIDYGNFNYPTHIFIGKDRRIYVTDSMNFRIQLFDTEGRFVSCFGKHGDGTGDFSKPKGIAVDSQGHIYVADAHFDNVQIFDPQGKTLLAFGSSGKGFGEFTIPAGVYIDNMDKIYVADSYNKRIQIFQYVKE